MSETTLGIISETERNDLLKNYQRKTALMELMSTIPSYNNDIYEKIVADLARTNEKIGEWWKNVANKYGWMYTENYMWKVDFDNNSVTIYEKT